MTRDRAEIVGRRTVDAVTRGVLAAACWADAFREDGTGDVESVSGFTPDRLVSGTDRAREVAADFLAGNLATLAAFVRETGVVADGIGHDLWLTANSHGAGFWDRGAGPIGDELTAAAHPYGDGTVYVFTDGTGELEW